MTLDPIRMAAALAFALSIYTAQTIILLLSAIAWTRPNEKPKGKEEEK